jgi:membrane peptidoglycan carboxypeptidase
VAGGRRGAEAGGSRPMMLVAVFVALSLVAGLLAAGVALPVLGSLGMTAKAASDHFEDMPSDMRIPVLPQRTIIQDVNGNQIAQVWGNFGDRVVEPASKISPNMDHAIVSIEDIRFYQHGALDLRGTLRAAVSDTSGGNTQGGSTLTQQYVKNMLLLKAGTNPAKQKAATADTLGRKIQELRYAIAVFKSMSRQQILTNYLNLVYFGEGAYGVQAAAQRYFSTDAADLTVPQAATLAAVVNSPSYYDPLAHPRNALARRNQVIKDMADPIVHFITPAQAAKYQKTPIGTKPQSQQSGCITAPGSSAFFCQYVENELLTNPLYGATAADRQAFFDRGGLIIRTTLNPADEQAAQTAIANQIAPSDPIDADVVMIQPGTGQILAMAQSKAMGSGPNQVWTNYAAGPNHGGTAGFQAGSTFKVFVAMAALEQGLSPATQINSPAQLSNGPPISTCNGPWLWPSDWHPADQTGDQTGKVSMTTAFWESLNTYFIKLEERTGLCQPATIAQDLGVTKDNSEGNGQPLDQYGTFTLGTNPITPIEMANAYATIAANGTYCQPTILLSVTSLHGHNSYPVPQANCHPVINPTITNTLTGMLQGVIASPNGTGHITQQWIGTRPAAGKTGTNDYLSMTWFDGYTPNLAAAVWVGNPNDPTHPVRNLTLHGTTCPPTGCYLHKLYGLSEAAPIWGQAVGAALQNQPAPTFTQPAYNANGTA